MNNSIMSFMKKGKGSSIEKQCRETEDNLRKGIPTRERLDHCETRESYYHPRWLRKMPHRKTRDTEPVERILL